jgi:trans-aconitate methyltransferase
MVDIDFNGMKYRTAAVVQHDLGLRMINELPLQGNESILDLGCGDGSLSAKLAERVPEGNILAIDSSETMLSTAIELEKENLKFQLQDINTMHFDEKFDVIYSNATLHWIQDHNRLLKECYSALKPNGIIYWNFGSAGNVPNLTKAIHLPLNNPKYQKYFPDQYWPWFLYSLKQYQKLCKNYKFQELRIWTENIKHSFPNKESLIDWVDMPCLVPFLKYLPINDQKSFRDEVINLMLKLCAKKDNIYNETFVRLNVIARK